MKIVRREILISVGQFPTSADYQRIEKDLEEGIAGVHWPPKSRSFIIYPESGKKRNQGNGVKPIKLGMMSLLRRRGWQLEKPLDLATVDRPGKLDAVLETSFGPFAVEWETGNISSSHRAINKMALGLLKRKLAGGTLIVPSRELYAYLTDRVGNISELEPYLDLWRTVPCSNGLLQIIVVEHDGTSRKVPRIGKCTDGRALA